MSPIGGPTTSKDAEFLKPYVDVDEWRDVLS
jgi:hypothetical protein